MEETSTFPVCFAGGEESEGRLQRGESIQVGAPSPQAAKAFSQQPAWLRFAQQWETPLAHQRGVEQVNDPGMLDYP